MRREEAILALDVGSSKIAALVGRLAEGEQDPELLGSSVSPSRGLRAGIVVDLEQAAGAVREAVTRVQRAAGAELVSAWMSVSGSHISSLNSRGQISLRARERQIGRQQVERALAEAAQAVALEEGREVLHSIARAFCLDGQDGVRNPIGMSSAVLEVEAHIVTAAGNLVDNLERCVQQAGLEVEGLVLSPLAAAECLLSEAERELGTAVLDLGAGTTELAACWQGRIWHTAVIPYAGDYITRDIAIGLGVRPEAAEHLKVQRGSVSPGLIPEEEVVPLAGAGEPARRHVPRRLLARIFEARAREILRMAATELQRAGCLGRLAGGVVLCGGTAGLPGIGSLAEEVLGCPVRIGVPARLTELTEEGRAGEFAVAAGLLAYGARRRGGQSGRSRSRGRSTWLGSLQGWARELFEG